MLGSQCYHIESKDLNGICQKFAEEIEHRNRITSECQACGWTSQFLWMCLDENCLKIFCSDVPPNHVLQHYKQEPSHCLGLNLSTYRIWCQECNAEIPVQMDSQPEEEPRGLVGLQNLGNTCYMNAALQSLANIPPLVDRLLAGPFGTTRLDRHSLTKHFGRLLANLCSSNSGVIGPHQILHAIRHTHPMYRGFQQHDSQEFLRCLLDQMHEELKIQSLEPMKTSSYSFDSDDTSDLENSSEAEDYETCDSGVSEQSTNSDERSLPGSSRPSSPMERWRPQRNSQTKKKQVHYRSIISDVFNGTLLSSVQCLTCNRVSSRVETFQDLSLPIPGRDTMYLLQQSSTAGQRQKCGHLATTDQGWLSWFWECVSSWIWGPTISLEDCLAAFFSADELKGDNMYSCEKCGKLRNGVKYSRLLSCPEVLCVHLKRFRHEPTLSSKINSHISFALEGLDLSPYIAPDCHGGVTKYNLVSIICHHGHGGNSGHYTCLAKNRFNGKWYEFDDATVTPINNVTSAKAYVLFYQKDDTKILRARRRAAMLHSLHSEEERLVISKEWLERFGSLSQPGAIDNRGILCPHRQLAPEGEFTVVSKTVWEYLRTRFGGGPELNFDIVVVCDICSEFSGQERLQETRKAQEQETQTMEP